MSEQGFYVFPEQCIGCGAPELEAPDLMGHRESPNYHCCFLRQPETPGEVDQAIAAVWASCCGAVQYLGNDRAILKRVSEAQRLSFAPLTWVPDLANVRTPFGRGSVLKTPRRQWMRRGFLVGWMVLLTASSGKAILVREPTEVGMWWVLGAFAAGLLCFGGWVSER